MNWRGGTLWSDSMFTRSFTRPHFPHCCHGNLTADPDRVPGWRVSWVAAAVGCKSLPPTEHPRGAVFPVWSKSVVPDRFLCRYILACVLFHPFPSPSLPLSLPYPIHSPPLLPPYLPSFHHPSLENVRDAEKTRIDISSLHFP